MTLFPFIVIVSVFETVGEKGSSDDPSGLQNPLKTLLDGELQIHESQKKCNYMVLATAGNSALSLPLTMPNRQRLLWAHLITVHHAASFILRCSKKLHIKMTHFQVYNLWEKTKTVLC